MADDDAIAFVLRLGRALHALGYSSHRIEELLAEAAARLRLEGQFFTTPTSIFSAFGPQEQQRTFLVRVEPGDLHLERLGRVQEIAEGVIAGRRTPREGVAALDALDREPPRWGVALTTLAFGIAGGSAACLLGGAARRWPRPARSPCSPAGSRRPTCCRPRRDASTRRSRRSSSRSRCRRSPRARRSPRISRRSAGSSCCCRG